MTDQMIEAIRDRILDLDRDGCKAATWQNFSIRYLLTQYDATVSMYETDVTSMQAQLDAARDELDAAKAANERLRRTIGRLRDGYDPITEANACLDQLIELTKSEHT